MKYDHLMIDILIQLLKITHFKDIKSIEDNIQNSSLAFTNIIKITQNKWLRPAGKERWDLKDCPLFIKHRNDIIKLVAKLGFVDEVKPYGREYDCVLLLGASDINLIKRIHYLNKLWNNGIRYKKVYLLTGGIRIEHDVKCFNNMFSEVNDKLETDTELIMETYKKIHTDNWQEIEVIPIIAREKQPRPNTEDTLRAWLEKNEGQKKILVISNQPFVPYQDSVVRRVLAPLFFTETVGDSIEISTPIAVILDSVARCLYEHSLIKH